MQITTLFSVSIFISGFVLGAILVALWMRGRMVELDAARRLAEVNLSSAQTNPGKLAETFQAMADQALRATQQTFLDSARSTLETVRVEMTGDMTQRQNAVETVVKPLTESLAKLEVQVREIETARQHAFGGIEQQLQTLSQRELELQKETASLVNALRAPQVRGRWGEMTLRRVAEIARTWSCACPGTAPSSWTPKCRSRPTWTPWPPPQTRSAATRSCATASR
jgi:DNA anti-recombination protein RmuC